MADERVDDDEVLYRRVPHRPNHFRHENGRIRVTSQAFSDRRFRPSVDRATLCGNDPTSTQTDPTDAVASLITFQVRGIDTVEQRDERGEVVIRHAIDVEPNPIRNDPVLPDNPAHAEIYAIPEMRNERTFRRLREALAMLAEWQIPPHGDI
jgi:hypothetical protein